MGLGGRNLLQLQGPAEQFDACLCQWSLAVALAKMGDKAWVENNASNLFYIKMTKQRTSLQLDEEECSYFLESIVYYGNPVAILIRAPMGYWQTENIGLQCKAR